MKSIYKSEAGRAELQHRYRTALDAWPVPAERLHVPTREGDTFVLVSGPADAPPLVLLHGSGANATMWLPDVAEWSRDFRVHAVDVIGEPGQSAESRPSFKSDAYALWLDDVLDALGLREAHFAATSLGGWLALDYALRRPSRVTRLALLAPAGLGRQKIAWLLKALVLRPFKGRESFLGSARAATGLTSAEMRPALESIALTFAHFVPRTDRLPRFPESALRALEPPLLVIVGADDTMIDSAGTARRVRGALPRATLTVLPDTGHAIFGQTAAVSAFLRS